MATEETNSPEFQEKAGLKRKPTGPPRLILGKSKSPGQDEKKSDARNHRRQNTTDTPTTDATQGGREKNKAACEMHEIISESSQSGQELEKEIHLDVQEESLGTSTDSEHNMVKKHIDKKVRKRNRSKATFQRFVLSAFMCVRKNKELESTLVVEDDMAHRDIPTNNDELQIPSGDSLNVTKVFKADQKKKAERRLFSERMWSIFKRCSVTSKFNQGQDKTSAGQVNNRFIEIVPEKSDEIENVLDGSECCAPETPEDDHENGSGVINKDMTTIHGEGLTERALGCQDKGTDNLTNVVDLKTEVIVDSSPTIIPDSDGLKSHIPSVEPMIEFIANSEPFYLSNSILPCIYESGSDAEEPAGASECVVLTPEKTIPTKPVITIEDVHSSDEENQEPIENTEPPCATMSGLLSLNECYKSKTKTDYTLKVSDGNKQINQLSDILLAQTAFNLVQSAISGALEQLAADQQRQRDVDHV